MNHTNQNTMKPEHIMPTLIQEIEDHLTKPARVLFRFRWIVAESGESVRTRRNLEQGFWETIHADADGNPIGTIARTINETEAAYAHKAACLALWRLRGRWLFVRAMWEASNFGLADIEHAAMLLKWDLQRVEDAVTSAHYFNLDLLEFVRRLAPAGAATKPGEPFECLLSPEVEDLLRQCGLLRPGDGNIIIPDGLGDEFTQKVEDAVIKANLPALRELLAGVGFPV